MHFTQVNPPDNNNERRRRRRVSDEDEVGTTPLMSAVEEVNTTASSDVSSSNGAIRSPSMSRKPPPGGEHHARGGGGNRVGGSFTLLPPPLSPAAAAAATSAGSTSSSATSRDSRIAAAASKHPVIIDLLDTTPLSTGSAANGKFRWRGNSNESSGSLEGTGSSHGDLPAPPLSFGQGDGKVAAAAAAVRNAEKKASADGADLPPPLPTPPPLSQFIVDDHHYQAWIRSGRDPRFRHGDEMIESLSLTAPCCARVCAGFSFVAMIFLIWVGTLIQVQPIFIKGIPVNEFSNHQQQQQQYAQQSKKNSHNKNRSNGHERKRRGRRRIWNDFVQQILVPDSYIQNSHHQQDGKDTKLPLAHEEMLTTTMEISAVENENEMTKTASANQDQDDKYVRNDGSSRQDLGESQKDQETGDNSNSESGQDPTNQQRNLNNKSNSSYNNSGRRRHGIRKESAVAFQAAAAYFLAMVLALTYAQLYDKIEIRPHHPIAHAMCRVRYMFRQFLTAMRQLRRRQYESIPDDLSTVPSIHTIFQGDPLMKDR